MGWEIIEIEIGGKNKASPSVSVGYGRMCFNISACNLLGQYEQYNYVQLLADPTRISEIGVQFFEEAEEKSIPIKRKKSGGKFVGGLEISSKVYMEKIFGITGTQKKTTTYPVKKESKDTLVVMIK